MGRYAYLLNKMMAERNLNAMLLSRAWCAPLLHWRSSLVDRCGGYSGEEFESAFIEVLNDSDIDTVVLVAEWGMYATGFRYDVRAIAYDFVLDEKKNTSVVENADQFDLAFARTLSELRAAGKEVILVGPVPEYNFDIPSVALSLSIMGSRDFASYMQHRDEYEQRNADVFKAFEVNDANVEYIDVWSIICEGQICSPFTDDGLPLYSDDNHLVTEGMQHVVDEIMRRLM